MPQRIQFEKFHGAGNDFVVIDNRKQAKSLPAENISHLCDRHFGIGADGLLVIEHSDRFDFRMRYYNSDGNEATFCGNGGRCVAAWSFDHAIAGAEMQFEAADGIHRASVVRVSGDRFNVVLSLNDVQNIQSYPDGFYMNTGTPHFVRLVDEISQLDILGEGRKIRYDSRFAPHGTNANFMAMDGDDINVRTYEKGVEAETLSCGTGITASALIAMHLLNCDKGWITVHARGGVLKMYAERYKESYHNILLAGEATRIFKGQITL